MAVKRVFAVTCGYVDTDVGFLMGTQRGLAMQSGPVPVYLVEHARGLVLVDTGMHPNCMTDPIGHWGRIAKRLNVPVYAAGQDPRSRVRALGFDPDAIRHVVLSHLHYDHAGCNALFPAATLYVQEAEWNHAVSLMHDDSSGYVAEDFFHPLRYDRLRGEAIDLFGDGSVVTVPSPGHSPGHQAVLARLPRSGPLLLTADAVYSQSQWEAGTGPGHAWNKGLAADTVRMLRELAVREGAGVFIGHDPAHWQTPPLVGPDFILVPCDSQREVPR